MRKPVHILPHIRCAELLPLCPTHTATTRFFRFFLRKRLMQLVQSYPLLLRPALQKDLIVPYELYTESSRSMQV